MDPSSITQQLAKQADTGTAAIILLLLVLFVLCWPRIVDGIERLRGKKTVSVDGDVRTVGPFVTCGECKQHRAAIGKRIDTVDERIKKVDCDIAAVRSDVSMLRSDITNSNRAVIDKLDEIDKRSEDRAKELYRRIDPLADKTAENAATVAIVKEVFVDTVKSATTGGKK